MNDVPVIEFAAFVIILWPWLSLALSDDLRRVFPRVQRALALGLLGAMVGFMILASLAPVTLQMSLALLAACTFLVRCRDAYQPHLPPGPRTLATTIEALAKKDFYQQSFEKLGPIFKMNQFHRSVACVVGLQRAHGLLKEHKDSLAPCPLPFHHALRGGFLRYMDPEIYSIYGPLFRQALSGQVVQHTSPNLEISSRLALGQIALNCSPVDDTLETVVTDIFFESLFGLRPGTPPAEEFHDLYRPFAEQPFGQRPSGKTLSCLNRLVAHLDDRAGTSLPQCALRELGTLDARMPDVICLENLLYIARISVGNVCGLLRWILSDLAMNRAWWELLQDRPRDTALTDRIVKESLRLHQSEYLYRTVTRTFDYQGFRFPKGWLLRICVGESHRDPELFPEPHTYNPDRFLIRPAAHTFSPFGMLEHSCNGVFLTHKICHLVLGELAELYALRLIETGPPTRRFRHWAHWEPTTRYAFSARSQP
jgi:hypothetical protein